MDITSTISDQLDHAHKIEMIGLADEADAGMLTAVRTLKRLREYRNNVDIKLDHHEDLDYGTVTVLMIELERLMNPSRTR